MGRPKIPEDAKQKYQRVALYPETHRRIKEISDATNEDLVDVFDKISKQAYVNFLDSRTQPA